MKENRTRDRANPPAESPEAGEFTREAARGQTSFLREYWDFLRHEKRWWMTPILLALLIAAGFVIIGGSVAAPFIYALF